MRQWRRGCVSGDWGVRVETHSAAVRCQTSMREVKAEPRKQCTLPRLWKALNWVRKRQTNGQRQAFSHMCCAVQTKTGFPTGEFSTHPSRTPHPSAFSFRFLRPTKLSYFKGAVRRCGALELASYCSLRLCPFLTPSLNPHPLVPSPTKPTTLGADRHRCGTGLREEGRKVVLIAVLRPCYTVQRYECSKQCSTVVQYVHITHTSHYVLFPAVVCAKTVQFRVRILRDCGDAYMFCRCPSGRATQRSKETIQSGIVIYVRLLTLTNLPARA